MAEGSDEGSWWGGWLQVAKDKSASALEFVKKDLAEFTCTVQNDTSVAAEELRGKLNQENAVSAKDKVKAGVGSFLSGISRALVIEPDDKNYPGEPITTYDRAQAQLHAIQIDPGTYLTEPSGSKEDFEKWIAGFNIDSQKGDISELLVANVEVRSLYTQLVPSQVSHACYWQRYFYKVHKWQLEQQRKADLVRRADECSEQKDMGWDEEDDWGDLAGPSSPPKFAPSVLSRETVPVVSIVQAPEQTAQPPVKQVEQPLAKQNDQAGADLPEPEASGVEEQDKTDEKKDTDEPVENTQTSVGESTTVKVTLLHEDYAVETPESESSKHLQDIVSHQTVAAVVSPTDTLSSSTGISRDDSSLDTLTIVSPVSADDTPEDAELKAFPKSTNVAEEKGLGAAELTSEIKTREKGDLVVVGSSSDRTTPSSDSANSNNKSTSLDDDWEHDFDMEMTEEDMRLAQEASKHLDEGDEWEDWE